MLTIFRDQPKPFYLIFSLELWERFGYYTVYGVLALFFVKTMGFSDKQSFYTFGAFSALVFGLASLGGFVGDKVLGTKRTTILGMITLAVGYFALSVANQQTIFLALAIICVGNGLFKANPSSLLAKCYQYGDPRLHGAFTLYYMAINIGSVFALLIGPTVASRYGWHAAFFLSCFGLTVGLINFWFWRKTVAEINHGADCKRLSLKRLSLVLVAMVAMIGLCTFLLQRVDITEKLLAIVTLVVLGIYCHLAFNEQGLSQKKMWVALVLMAEAVVFFTLYQQMPTSLNFFAIHNVNTQLFGIHFNAQSFQVLNPLWIMVLSPCLAWLYSSWHKSGANIGTAHKFALGMTLCGLSFSLLYFTRYFGDASGIVSPWWLVASYFFQSSGELLVSALGVAMVAELVPASIAGFTMGMWFLTSSIAGFTGAFVASLTEAPTSLISGSERLAIYSTVFLKIGVVTLFFAAVMLKDPLIYISINNHLIA